MGPAKRYGVIRCCGASSAVNASSLAKALGAWQLHGQLSSKRHYDYTVSRPGAVMLPLTV